MRKTITILLVLSFLLTLASTAFAGGQAQAAAEDDVMTITTIAYNIRGYPARQDTLAQQALEEHFDIRIQVWEGVDQYEAEQVQVRLAGGDIPDFWNGNPRELSEIGAIRPVPEDSIRTHMPSYIGQVEEVGGSQLPWTNTRIGGQNYAIPTALSIAAAGPAMALRNDWIENVGWTRPIDTLEDLEELLLRFVNDDPNGTGTNDTFAYSDFKNSATLYNIAYAQMFGAYGVRIRTWEIHGNEVGNSMISDGYRDALRRLSRWYELGIIHPEYPVHRRTETSELLLNDRTGVFEEWSSWLAAPEGPLGLLSQQNPGLEYTYVVSPAGPDGTRGNYSRPAAPWGAPGVIGYHVSDDKMVRILQIIDELYTNPDLYGIMLRAGFRGEHWEIDPESGAAVWIGDAGEPENWAARGGMGLFRTNAVLPETDHIYMDANRYPIHDWIRENETALDFGFAPVWDEDQSVKYADMMTLEEEFYFGVMTGRVNLDRDWDNYVQRWLQIGGTELLEEATRQYRELGM